MKKIFTLLSLVALAVTANAQIVINEVYGGGGNSGTTLKQDFVELYNRGTSPVTLTNAYIQYGSATGVFGGTGTPPNIFALPASITINPGKYYLIQGAAGAGGTVNLDTPDFTISTLAMSATGGKVALTTDNVVVTSATQSNVIDLVGWNTTTNIFEGSGRAPATTATTSISRTNGIDTNNNAADFTTGTPSPRNSSFLSVGDIKVFRGNFVKNTIVTNEISFGEKANVKIYNVSGSLVKSASVEKNTSLNVSSLPKGVYVVTGEVNGQSVSQKIVKE